MPLPPTVLVVAATNDLGADLVVRDLANHETNVHRIDPNDLAKSGVLRLTGCADNESLRFLLSDENRTTPSTSIVSVFWWHPDPPEGWAEGESRAVLEGLLYGLEDVMWVNHPHRASAAKPGPAQLKQAAKVGLRTPHTIYTNDPEEAVRFADKHNDRAVCKTLTGHSRRFVPARIVTAEQIQAEAESVRRAVHYFQQPVEKVYDIRLTAIGDRLFPCKITAQDGVLDWRAAPEEKLSFDAVGMSQPLVKKVRKLMGQLRLEYAALDFAVDASGSWWFLEANPSGQFGFVQAATDMVISRAIADHLVSCARDSSAELSEGVEGLFG
ncbi:hypothetical protein [Streptomyces sp. NPDC054794]